MERSTDRILARGNFEEFGATIGFDALRVAMGGRPRNHDVDTICRWLRHVSAATNPADPLPSDKTDAPAVSD